MNNIKLWETEYGVNSCRYYNSFDELLVNDCNITSFIIKDRYSVGDTPEMFLDNIGKKQNLNITYTDLEHPIFYTETDGFVINSEFYKIHGTKIIDLCQRNIIKSPNKRVRKEVFDEEFFEKIIDSIDENSLVEQDTDLIQFYDIDLSEEQIQMLKNRHVDAYVNKNNNNIQVSSSIVLGTYTKFALHRFKSFEFTSNLSEEEFEYLKEINDGSIIRLYNLDYKNVIKIINKLESLGKHVKVGLMEIKRKDYPYKAFASLNLNSVELVLHENVIDVISLEDYIKQEEIIELMIKDIRDKDLSPLEKYMVIYEIVKKFKQYKESKDDLQESRDLSRILFNNYIVCVGFSHLLVELLSRVGINAKEYSVKVDTSYDAGFTKEEIPENMEGHMRVIVYLEDAKYNISGYYMSDPTWDNHLEKNMIIYSLMTFDKLQTQRRRAELNIENIIFDNHNFDEFCTKINFFIKRTLNNLRGFTNITDPVRATYQSLYDKIIELIKLDTEGYEKIISKYPTSSMTIEEYNNFFTDVGHYIISKTNKKIDVQKLLLATGVIYKEILGMDDDMIKKETDKMIEDNQNQYKISFPYHVDSKNEFKLKKGSDEEFSVTNPYKGR